MSAILELPARRPSSTPETGDIWVTGKVRRLELTPKGRRVRIILEKPVEVPFANLNLLVRRLWFDPVNELLPANALHAGRVAVLTATPDEIRARDIREGDTIEIGIGIRWQPVARGPVLCLRPAWAVPFTPVSHRAGGVRHA